ncbi:hypothetical protein JW905_17300, partial [bacterium]|nr:hypothetical protein [candidate division CSSED10-310 bacterium]
PKKYPLMFRKADILVLSKASLDVAFGYNYTDVGKNMSEVNGTATVFITDAKNGAGMQPLVDRVRALAAGKRHA